MLLMTGVTPVFEAKRWVEKAPTGGSQSQVFELRDGRYVVVKFPENQQGERVLANEFLSCALAEALQLPVNRAVLIAVDGRLLRDPQASGDCPPSFTAGIRCGMVRFPNAVGINEQQLSAAVVNHCDIHAIHVFDTFIARGDSRQLLSFQPGQGATSERQFAAIDYGYSFGGSPAWTVDTFRVLASPVLPAMDPCTGKNYTDGDLIEPIILKLRALNAAAMASAFGTLHAPRWSVTEDEISGLQSVLEVRRNALIEQFDKKFKKQLEAF